MRWKEAALGNLTKDCGLVMRGQGWPLGEEEDKRRGSNWVYGEKKGSVNGEQQVHSLCGGLDCVVPTQMELLVAGQELDSALPKTSAVESLC